MELADASLDRAVAWAAQRPEVTTLWLYGSRARGDHAPDSDYDLAVSFASQITAPIEAVTRLEALRSSLQQIIGGQVSLVELDRAPTPLAASITAEGALLMDKTPVITGWLCQRIWSKWEDWSVRRRANSVT